MLDPDRTGLDVQSDSVLGRHRLPPVGPACPASLDNQVSVPARPLSPSVGAVEVAVQASVPADDDVSVQPIYLWSRLPCLLPLQTFLCWSLPVLTSMDQELLLCPVLLREAGCNMEPGEGLPARPSW